MKNIFRKKQAISFIIVSILFAISAQAASLAPYRILYNSDTTHILSCVSAWRPNRESLSVKMFQETVNEAADAGADAFMMASGLGWVPWWPSEVLPPKEQVAWFQQHFNMPRARTPYMDFILQGNDIIKISLESCRKRGMAFFISFRMNDQHGKEGALTKPTPGHILSVPSLYANNPQYLLGPQAQQPRWAAFVQNWAHQEVRDYKFKLIEELCQNYDLDGLELDFMRAPYYFKIAETTAEQRREIMLSFIKRVRKLLDETETPNKHRWLCVRIPSYISAYDTMGIDISAWHGAGVDMFETSSFYDTEQTTDFALIRAQAPGAAFYPELTSSIAFNGNTADRSFRRATREYLETAAHTAYTEGARGVMLFNYQYYRDNRARGSTLKANEPFTEPPFAWIKALGSPETVAKRPQYYFIGTILAGDPRREYPFPANIKPGGECVFEIDLAPPAGGWKTDTRMRMQAAAGIGGGVFEARCNGVLLAPMTDAGEPYPNVYTQMLGAPDALQAWRLPVSAMKAGRNTIVIKQTDGTPTKLIALDIAAR